MTVSARLVQEHVKGSTYVFLRLMSFNKFQGQRQHPGNTMTAQCPSALTCADVRATLAVTSEKSVGNVNAVRANEVLTLRVLIATTAASLCPHWRLVGGLKCNQVCLKCFLCRA
jgi:hypothetical protein